MSLQMKNNMQNNITNEPRTIMRALSAYRTPSITRSIIELLVTLIPFALLWTLSWAALSAGYWLSLLITIPAAGFLVRLFMIKHDCSHGAFFSSKATNECVGRVIGVLNLTPFDFWRHTHRHHHAHSGNLDRPRIGGIDTLTVEEFRALTRNQKQRYRFYRHPLVLFAIGPAYLFLLDNRLPVGFMRAGWMPWLSTMSTNVAILVIVATMMWLVGIGPFLMVQLPITLLAATIGVWLFYVQHQFEDTYWAHESNWTLQQAALHGSSYYELPGILRWFTANIGFHHIHHLSSRIPFYRLPEVLRDYPELREVGRLTLWQSFASVRLALWDEDKRRLVSFREAKG